MWLCFVYYKMINKCVINSFWYFTGLRILLGLKPDGVVNLAIHQNEHNMSVSIFEIENRNYQLFEYTQLSLLILCQKEN